MVNLCFYKFKYKIAYIKEIKKYYKLIHYNRNGLSRLFKITMKQQWRWVKTVVYLDDFVSWEATTAVYNHSENASISFKKIILMWSPLRPPRPFPSGDLLVLLWSPRLSLLSLLVIPSHEKHTYNHSLFMRVHCSVFSLNCSIYGWCFWSFDRSCGMHVLCNKKKNKNRIHFLGRNLISLRV